MSLAQLTTWCDRRFAPFAPVADHTPRRFDIPWLVMDSRRVRDEFAWKPERALESILEEIARHVRDNPTWLDRCDGN
jgi:CDP-paratose 2-epimerase